MNLLELGWGDSFAEAFRDHDRAGRLAGRVAVQHRGAYELLSEQGEWTAEVSGAFRHAAQRPADFPVTGDWVAFEPVPNERKGIIHAVLPRRTRISRNAAGDSTEEQILGANLDVVWIVEALSASPNLRRVERCLTLAWESGAEPILLLTKADLCQDPAATLQLARRAAGAAPVHLVSSLTGQGLDEVRRQVGPGRTGVLLGPSGVGKSTLINRLCGEDRQQAQPVRERDHKGRHTTTRRELILLPGAGLLLDTPGMRELQLWEGAEGLEDAFGDIAELARHCRFSDCQHRTEPGCAVLQALGDGSLDAARLESHRKLERELGWFETRHNARAQAEQRRRLKTIARSLRQHPKYQHKQDP